MMDVNGSNAYEKQALKASTVWIKLPNDKQKKITKFNSNFG